MLQDKSDIQDVLTTYATACDYRQWELLEKVFANDVRVNYGDAFHLEGIPAVTDMIKSFLGGCGPTQHLLGNFRISVDGDSSESACYVQATHFGKETHEGKMYTTWAEYRDKLERKKDGWKIIHRHMFIINDTGSPEILGPAE